ncbi:hypothetical protein ASF61_04550 [Duganella sp. Leaf126]|uniref:TolC family protein n=1 Tax=Duganella sp. Leaf126 TaxID=1736266 RepID=UPI0006F6775E|nr:TolC family protein [Duganella sp. Leaf126]KQQ40075.1 hypothetical protein ASF61_04550 [Duganella sp. Leaf126]
MRAVLAVLGYACALAAGGAHAGLPLAGDVLYALPPEAAVRRSLAALPQLRLGALEQDLAAAERDKLTAGTHEWIARVGAAQRRVEGERRYREQELGVERAVRWFGKADQDRRIGEQGVALAQARRTDAWHEAGRALMQDWYDALRALATVQLLSEQHALMLQLQSAAALRVQAGDAPALERMQAGTELARAEAALAQARHDAAQALALLATTYGALPAPTVDRLPEPQDDADDVATRVASIVGDNHELELAAAEAQFYALKARRAASERMPDPTLGLRSTRERDGQERTLGVTLSIPLGGAARSAEGAAAAVQARMADERVDQTRARVQRDAQRAVTEQRHAYRHWAGLRDVAQQSAHQAALIGRAYQAGEVGLAEALLSRRQALDATLAAHTAQIAALAAAARVRLDAHALWAID